MRTVSTSPEVVGKKRRNRRNCPTLRCLHCAGDGGKPRQREFDQMIDQGRSVVGTKTKLRKHLLQNPPIKN